MQPVNRPAPTATSPADRRARLRRVAGAAVVALLAISTPPAAAAAAAQPDSRRVVAILSLIHI